MIVLCYFSGFHVANVELARLQWTVENVLAAEIADYIIG